MTSRRYSEVSQIGYPCDTFTPSLFFITLQVSLIHNDIKGKTLGPLKQRKDDIPHGRAPTIIQNHSSEASQAKTNQMLYAVFIETRALPLLLMHPHGKPRLKSVDKRKRAVFRCPVVVRIQRAHFHLKQFRSRRPMHTPNMRKLKGSSGTAHPSDSSVSNCQIEHVLRNRHHISPALGGRTNKPFDSILKDETQGR